MRDVVHIVRNEQDGHAVLLMQFGKTCEERGARTRVESRCRLIEHEIARLERQNACDRRTPPLPSGQSKRRPRPELGDRKPHEVQRRPHALLNLLRGKPETRRAKRDILFHRLLEELMLGVLEDHTDAALRLLRLRTLLADVRAVDKNRAAVGLQKAVEMLHERRFTRSRMPGERREAARLDRQRDVRKSLALKRRAAHVCVVDIFQHDGQSALTNSLSVKRSAGSETPASRRRVASSTASGTARPRAFMPPTS